MKKPVKMTEKQKKIPKKLVKPANIDKYASVSNEKEYKKKRNSKNKSIS